MDNKLIPFYTDAPLSAEQKAEREVLWRAYLSAKLIEKSLKKDWEVAVEATDEAWQKWADFNE